MDFEIHEPDAIGKTKTVCGNCHYHRHHNQATKPCVLNNCVDFTYCGIKEKHPEYFVKLNSFKLERRKKENEISELENQVKAIEQFATTSEHQFIKNLALCMYNMDPYTKLINVN
jgi:gentisate 1,2-dioxygenase